MITPWFSCSYLGGITVDIYFNIMRQDVRGVEGKHRFVLLTQNPARMDAFFFLFFILEGRNLQPESTQFFFFFDF